MTLSQFQAWALAQGEVAKTDGTVLGQCVSLINQYCYKVLGFVAGAWGDAYQWATSPQVAQHFDKVNNIQDGDVVVYPAGWAGSGPGHIGIAYQGKILEQNGHVANRVSLSKLEKGYYAILRVKGASAQGGNMPSLTTTGDVDEIYVALAGQHPDQATTNQYMGKPWPDVFNAVYGTKVASDFRALLAKQQSDSIAYNAGGSLSKDQVLNYIKQNLK